MINIGESYKFVLPEVQKSDGKLSKVWHQHTPSIENLYVDEDDMLAMVEADNERKKPRINDDDICIVTDVCTFKVYLDSALHNKRFCKGEEQLVVYLFDNKMFVKPIEDFIKITEKL